jgi:hypothetical protein
VRGVVRARRDDDRPAAADPGPPLRPAADPRADGRAFAGWYADAAAAAAASADPTTGASNPAIRINGSDLVSCTDQQKTLYGAWTTAAAAAAVGARIPIMMYHQFTDKPGGEDGWLRGNYSYIEDYRATMQYIKDSAFYLPTWDELSAFIDGALYLPDHSVIITDDDADPTGSRWPRRSTSSCSSW